MRCLRGLDVSYLSMIMKTTAECDNDSSRGRFDEEEDHEGDVLLRVEGGASQTRSSSPTCSDSSNFDSDVSGASSFNELFDDPDQIFDDVPGRDTGTEWSNFVPRLSKEGLKNRIDRLNNEVAGGLLRDRQRLGGGGVEQTVRRVWQVGNVFVPLSKDRSMLGVEREGWMGKHVDRDDSWKVFMSAKTASIVCPRRPPKPGAAGEGPLRIQREAERRTENG